MFEVGVCECYEKSKEGQMSFSNKAGMPAWHISFLGLTLSSVFLVAKRRAQRTGMPKAAVGHGNQLSVLV